MRQHPLRRWPSLALALLMGVAAGRRDTAVTDRDQYNNGTQHLLEGDLTSAEMLLHSAVAGQDRRLQPLGLYNLGLARFGIGAQLLEEAPDSRQVSRQAVSASTHADQAYQQGLTAMQQREQNELLRAYLRGRGARRELKEALKVLSEALDQYGDVLARWQRASGDFHSAHELSQDEDAQHNAEVADRHIAQLVDTLQQLQSMQNGMEEQMTGLEGMLEELGGIIPDDQGPPGAGEGDEEWPWSPEPGMEEERGREGTETPISPEDAARLLESFNLDRGRTLPMGFEEESDPEDLKGGKNW